MNGAELVVRVLESHGVNVVFGYPGSSVLPVYDKLKASGITHILPCHEQFACHAADGYARASGKTGVVLATSGPGATNLVTGIANAYMDSVPLVAITGNVSMPLLGHDAFQEIDIAGVTMPITKHNYIVKSVDSLASVLRNAFRIAESGRKGPVLVDIPTDIFGMETSVTEDDLLPMEKKKYTVSDTECDEAVAAVNASRFPFICAGGGVIASDASEAVTAFAHRLNCPTAVTAMGKGAFPAYDGLYAGVVGMKLTDAAREALGRCDLFIAVGARFSEKLVSNVTEYAPDAKILHIDIDAAETGKNTDYFSRVVGDVGTVLEKLLPRITQKSGYGFRGGYIPDGSVMSAVGECAAGCIVTTEVGLHQIDAVNAVPTSVPRTFITSGGLGTMGFGLPAAVGAALATGKRVINIAGDGSLNMNMQELMTAARYNLPITETVICNGTLGMIEKMQNDNYGGRIYQTKLPEVDYCAIAEGMGVRAYRPQSIEELKSDMVEAKASGKPAFILWNEPGRDGTL